MPIGTAVHERTLALCESLNYREWSGYYAVSAYESHHEHEYNAIRNAAALIDVSPLYKYLVTGRDAARFVDRLITRDVTKMAVGQVGYTGWCDDEGKLLDDGTISRLGDTTFRLTSAEPSLRWLSMNAVGLDVPAAADRKRINVFAPLYRVPVPGKPKEFNEAGFAFRIIDGECSLETPFPSNLRSPTQKRAGQSIQSGN